MTLPAPSPGRYKPLRCGLVELFLYEAQEFPFRDGRLLLRGDNGSGKSKVLALTLPLLLDANLSPIRMEPDADPNKRMAWNLLMGDAHEERTGYSWVEFGRVDDDGTEHFVTIGLGLKAVRQRGVVKQWWFITDQRIGDELHLIDRTRTVRTRERLIEAIGARGTVFDTAERYKRAVDEALFGLHDRYDALVDLLVHLRQPQLSKRPNEQQLSAALTESLRPMPDALIDTIAQSYQSLEEEERALASMRSSTVAVAAFTAENERYARVAVLRATVSPRRAQSEYEEQNRRARYAGARFERARAALEMAESDAAAAGVRLAQLQGAREALRERRESDELVQFAAARDLAAALRSAASAAENALRQATVAARAAQDALDQVLDDLARQNEKIEIARQTVLALASSARIELPVDSESAETVARSSSTEVARRQGHVTHLDTLLDTVAETERARASAQNAVDEAETRLSHEDETMLAAQAHAADAAALWFEQLSEQVGTAVLLRGDGLDEALEEARDWTSVPLAGANPASRWADETVRRVDAELEAEHAAHATELSRLRRAIDELEVEISELMAGTIRRPSAARTRPARRHDGGGAAFWECVDVRSHVPAEDAAGMEAALEAAGLLDAWINTDGTVIGVEGDAVLRPVPRDGPSLFDLLVPLDVRTVPSATVESILRSVALSDDPREGQVAISTSGGFALGPLVGSWRKPSAEYLGSTAREQARLARLESAESEHDALLAEFTEWEHQRVLVSDARASLKAERDGLPDDTPVRSTNSSAAFAAERRTEADRAVHARRGMLAGAIESQSVAGVAVAEAAELYSIDVGTLDAVRTALGNLPAAVLLLVNGLEEWERLQRRATTSEATDGNAVEARTAAERDAQSALAKAVSAEQRRDTLEATVGKEAREIERELEGVERDLQTATSQRTRLDSEVRTASNEVAVATSEVTAVEEAVVSATARRDAAAGEFRLFVSTGLLAIAVPALEIPDLGTPWAPDPTVRIARRALELLGGNDAGADDLDAAAGRLNRAFEILQGELSAQGRQCAWEQRHGVVVVSVQHGSEYVAPGSLLAELERELLDRERLLTEKERAILETHLIDEVGAQLHDRVREAQQQVALINQELDRRPTRSGLRLRIIWEAADGELDKQGRALLQQSAAAWSPADREAIGDYLRSRISSSRAEEPDGSWHERLRTAFDYRSWNRFSVQLHQNGVWRSASGPASGGERVLAASVPLFAAAASYYASAGNPHAPRLILLDEAFAGVDDRSRASYLGLLAEFDLDVVMTSEREWATYPEIPGIAIANLFRLSGTDAVFVEHWTWDGVSRERVADGGTSAIESAPPLEWGQDALVFEIDET